jgi:hypothetical protein
MNKIFEIKYGENLSKSFAIYEDGRIEGFEDFEPLMIINRIPLLVRRIEIDLTKLLKQNAR